MPKRSKESRRNKTLTEYFTHPPKSSKGIGGGTRVEQEDRSGVLAERSDVEVLIDELLHRDKEHFALEMERVSRGKRGEVAAPPKDLLNNELLAKLLSKKVRAFKEISCDESGLCIDGRRLSEVFTDEFGVRRQRAYLKTTRYAIYLDWAIEEGRVKKILPEAYLVETERGARAIVPTSFLCELAKRYGVILGDYKCSNGSK
ncbi:MAG: hypothetical protein N3E36_06420 [Sulfolobales archaeon]|nr:hypothetical protein [Sulfolobales archaeon]MCX8199637.1 hypothetical protein [Sulfolobales archaeon]MDW8170591.1 hypothetical protein [Desulfurococcaceae archaeon]